MKYEAKTVEDYINQLPGDRKAALQKLRNLALNHLPPGFEERIQYNMPSYVVPHRIYAKGYHVKPEDPLPFLSFASQKNHLAMYHSGIYTDPDLSKWFVEEYVKRTGKKPDMGKSCIRFRKPEEIPYDLIGELLEKISPEKWVERYEKIRQNK